jgi:hypothetical protein
MAICCSSGISLGSGPAIGQDRHHGQQRHDREVLHEQDGEGGLAVFAGDLALIPEHLDDEGGGREGEAGANQQRCRPVRQEPVEVDGDHQGRDNDLQRSQAEQRASQIPQPARLHFQADQEQQQDDAEFGEVAHVVHLGGDEGSRRMRPDDDAGDQQTENRTQTEVPEDDDGDRGNDEQQYRRINEGFGVDGHLVDRSGESAVPDGQRDDSRRIARRRP